MLSGVIAAFQTGTYTVRRRAAHTLTLGRVTEGAESDFTVDAVVQPLSGQQLSLLPGGMNAHNTRRIWTEIALQARATDIGPDIVEIAGEDYRVYQSQKWEGLDGDHYRALVTTWIE